MPLEMMTNGLDVCTRPKVVERWDFHVLQQENKGKEEGTKSYILYGRKHAAPLWELLAKSLLL